LVRDFTSLTTNYLLVGTVRSKLMKLWTIMKKSYKRYLVLKSLWLKALCYKLFSVKTLSKWLHKLTIKTKQLIVIIITSSDNNKRVDYNKNRWKKRVLSSFFLIAKTIIMERVYQNAGPLSMLVLNSLTMRYALPQFSNNNLS